MENQLLVQIRVEDGKGAVVFSQFAREADVLVELNLASQLSEKVLVVLGAGRIAEDLLLRVLSHCDVDHRNFYPLLVYFIGVTSDRIEQGQIGWQLVSRENFARFLDLSEVYQLELQNKLAQTVPAVNVLLEVLSDRHVRRLFVPKFY